MQSSYNLNEKMYTYDEYTKRVSKTTHKDIQSAASDYLKEHHYAVIILLPEDDLYQLYEN